MVHFPMLGAAGPLFCRVDHAALARLDGQPPQSEDAALAAFMRHRTAIEDAARRQFESAPTDVVLTSRHFP